MATEPDFTPIPIVGAEIVKPEVTEADILDDQPEIAEAKQMTPQITSALTGE